MLRNSSLSGMHVVPELCPCVYCKTKLHHLVTPACKLLCCIWKLLLYARSKVAVISVHTVLFRLLATCRSGHATKLTNQLA